MYVCIYVELFQSVGNNHKILAVGCLLKLKDESIYELKNKEIYKLKILLFTRNSFNLNN